MLTLIAGIGIGSIIAAAIGWRVSILNLRQASINALRDVLATYLKELEVMHSAVGRLLSAKTADELPELEKRKQETRGAVLFVYRRIMLRLSETNALDVRLAGQLQAFMRVENKVPDQNAIDDLLNVARRLLQRQWEDAAWWPLATPIRRWRGSASAGH